MIAEAQKNYLLQKASYDAATNEAKAQADLAYAEAQEQNTVIRAPFGGVVVKKMAEVGESVAPIPPGVNISTSSGAIVALADLETLEVEADVAEANVAKVKNGQPAEVTVEAIPDRRYKAVLRQVIPTADRTKATVMVKVTILDKDEDLKPEMSAKVTFLEPEKEQKPEVASAPVVLVPRAAVVTRDSKATVMVKVTILDKDKDLKPEMSAKVTFLEPEKEQKPQAASAPVVLVPRAAVVTRDGKSSVFLVRDGKARARAVVLGTERQGQVIVRDGLAGGETIVAKPPDGLGDGTEVRVKG